MGSDMMPACISPEFTSPLRPSTGIQEIMRMMFDVRKGTVQTRNSTICMAAVRMWKARK